MRLVAILFTIFLAVSSVFAADATPNLRCINQSGRVYTFDTVNKKVWYANSLDPQYLGAEMVTWETKPNLWVSKSMTSEFTFEIFGKIKNFSDWWLHRIQVTETVGGDGSIKITAQSTEGIGGQKHKPFFQNVICERIVNP